MCEKIVIFTRLFRHRPENNRFAMDTQRIVAKFEALYGPGAERPLEETLRSAWAWEKHLRSME